MGGGGGGVCVVGVGGLLNTIEFNMAVQWWQHGAFRACAKQTRFAKSVIDDSMRVSSPRLVAKQHVETVNDRWLFGENRSR